MLIDLGAVYRTLKNLIVKELAQHGAGVVTTTAAPPDRVPDEDNTISIYLFHLMESPESKNFPPLRGSGPVPVQQAPMGLILQYIITVIHTANSIPEENTLREQKLLGFVARTIHDFPVVTPQTKIDNEDVLDDELALQKNSIELILRPAPKEETISFWATEQQKVSRLSLFVEARVLMLEPKPPLTLPGIVLSVGEFVFPGTGPQLTDSRNPIWFRPPTEPDFRVVQASPARVALFPTADPPINPEPPAPPVPGGVDDSVVLDNDLITLRGVGLRPGRPTLLLRRGDFSIRVPLDLPAPTNAAWQFDVQSSSLSFRVRRQLRGALGASEVLSDVLLVPGLYSARLSLRDDRLQGMARTSNVVAFTVTPQIARVAATATPNTYTLTIVADYLLDTGIEIDLSIAGLALQRVSPTAPPNTLVEGAFEVTGASSIDFMLPATLLPPASVPSPDHPLAVRLVVDGATATPAWLTEVAP
jgi:uncharacterized protein DUF4255